jgi:GTP cyclohydrolase I
MDSIDEAVIKITIRKWIRQIPDVSEEVIANTPRRVVEAYKELLKGYERKPDDVLKEFDLPGQRVHVYECCEFYSLCEHHLLPFFGKVHIAYTAEQKAFGLSKLARLVEVFSRRLQIQERLTDQIASALYHALGENPRNGVFIVIEAKHLCMSMRGIQKQDVNTTTKASYGVYVTSNQLRSEFLAVLRSKKVKV